MPNAAPREPASRRPGGEGGRPWRRLAVAVPVSVLAHLALLLIGRPEYKGVADFAVDLEVVEVSPGAPPTDPDGPDEDLEPASQDPTLEAPDEPAPAGEPREPPMIAAATAEPGARRTPDGGVTADADAGPTAVAVAEGDGGPAEGTGICFHDVFAYAGEDPSWVLWVSMSSFNGTVYEEGLARTLGSFSLYKEMAGATGMDPYSEVDGFLVTATDFSDWRTYAVVATYNSGEELMLSRLKRNMGDRPGFGWIETTSGYEASLPGKYRWHLVGAGRVLAVTHEPPATSPTGALPVPSAAPDAGLPPRSVAAPAHPGWPRQVACMEPEVSAPEPATARPFRDLIRAQLRPDSDGHWPVAVIATNDPRAIGLAGVDRVPAVFRWAMVRAFFSDPIRLEGTIRLEGSAQNLSSIEQEWRSMIARAGADPFLRMAGLGHLFDRVEIGATETGIDFTMPMTESQIQASLLFLQLQGEQLDKMINRRTNSAVQLRKTN